MKRYYSLLLTALLLTSCMTRMGHEDNDAQAQAAVQQMVDMIMSGKRAQLAEMASLPFWMDDWLTDRQSLQAKFTARMPESEPKPTRLMVRIYPLGDLAALRPKVWETLKASDPAYLKDLYVAAVALDLDNNPQSGLLLLRKVDGVWRLAGMLEE
ncbi:MAG TPA: hypothetical protein V6D23_05130 [Candidatus Obscuribacterales bacterium]